MASKVTTLVLYRIEGSGPYVIEVDEQKGAGWVEVVKVETASAAWDFLLALGSGKELLRVEQEVTA